MDIDFKCPYCYGVNGVVLNSEGSNELRYRCHDCGKLVAIFLKKTETGWIVRSVTRT